MTRPPMIWGVPYSAFMVNGMITMITFLLFKNLLLFLLALPIHGIAFLLALKDPRIFDLLLVKIRTSKPCPNRSFWGATSYSA